VLALLFRRCRLGRRTAAAIVFWLAALPGPVRADEAPSPPAPGATAKASAAACPLYATFRSDRPLALIPPSLMGKTGVMLGGSPPHRLLSSASTPVPHSPHAASLAGPALLSLDISLRYLRLAFQGDDRAGLLPFLGTSTTALGGLRLRF
jgi:hypothetical protein